MKKVFLIAAIVTALATGGFAEERGNPHLGKDVKNESAAPHPIMGAFAEKAGPYRGKGDFRGPSPHRMRNVTPYGDFCPNCSVYGVGYKHERISHKKAVSAMRSYFAKRGFTIGNIKGVGRFIKVDVYRDKELVDRIVFDKKTGRIRSIY